MRIVQINAIYGRLSTGVIMRDLRVAIENSAGESYVVFPQKMGMCDDHTYEMGSWIDHKLHALLSRFTGKQSYFSTRATNKLLNWMDDVKPDVVHLHNLHSNYIHLNMLLHYLAKKDIATVITMHDCWYFTGGCFHYASTLCDKWLQGCGDCPKVKGAVFPLIDATALVLKDRQKYIAAIPRLRIVGCSKWIANECEKSVLRDCEICYIYNGFDLDIFKPAQSNLPEKLGIEDKFIILGPASKWLSELNKNTFEYFVSAMSNDYVLVLFGASKTGWAIQSKVMLYGFTNSREEMVSLYSMADVFVNCSREDTLSSLNLEAQACGTPVVTYEATGSKETVDGKCGFAVETGCAEHLWQKVKDIRKKGKESFTRDCRKWIEKNFNKENNYQKYLDLYRYLTGK